MKTDETESIGVFRIDDAANSRGRRPLSQQRALALCERVVELARTKARPVRQKEFLQAGIHQQYVAIAEQHGLIVRLSRGIYGLPSEPTSQKNPWSILAAAAVRWPSLVVCGPTAAAFHGLIEDNGDDLWFAVPRGSGRPKGVVLGRGIRVREWLCERMTKDIEQHLIDGALVRIVSAPRAVAELLELASFLPDSVASSALLLFQARNKKE